MEKSSTLTSLSQSLEQSKQRELENVKKIEQESMSELAKSLKRSLETELSSIESDMSKRLTNLREKMSEARQKIVADEKATLNVLRENRAEIEDEALNLVQAVKRAKARYWIVPLIAAASITLGLALGLWGLGVAITDRTQTLISLNQEIAKAEQMKKSLDPYVPINKVYGNGFEVKKGYTIDAWKSKNGLWFAEVKKER
ncbi:MAG: hypothetical protein ACP5D3_07535 [Sulfurovum sp.]